MSVSEGSCFWNLRFEKSFSWRVTSTGDPTVLRVSGKGDEAAKRILNSLSNEFTTGPLRTVIICRCRWASVHVRLQSTKAACLIALKCEVDKKKRHGRTEVLTCSCHGSLSLNPLGENCFSFPRPPSSLSGSRRFSLREHGRACSAQRQVQLWIQG